MLIAHGVDQLNVQQDFITDLLTTSFDKIIYIQFLATSVIDLAVFRYFSPDVLLRTFRSSII